METQVNDTQLLYGLQHADRDAFNVIYRRYYRQFCYFAYGIVKEHKAAEDLVADAFIKLWQARPEFLSLEKLRAWMFTTIRHAGINLIKTRDRHDASHQELNTLAAVEESLDHIIIRSEALQAIYEAVDSLPAQCRRIIRGTFIEGKTTREIAAELDLAEQTVINQKNRGLKLLRETIKRNDLLGIATLALAIQILQEYRQ